MMGYEKQIVQLRRETDLKITAIADRVGYSKSLVSKVLIKHGLRSRIRRTKAELRPEQRRAA